jgi:hypothetical protein
MDLTDIHRALERLDAVLGAAHAALDEDPALLEARQAYLEAGNVSNVEMKTWMALIYKALFPSISTFETPPRDGSASPQRPRKEESRGALCRR